MDDAAVRALAAADCAWVPTLVTIGNLVGEGRYPDAVLQPLLDLQLRNGAYCVPHVQGTMDEYELLKRALGEKTDRVLEVGFHAIRDRFRR